MKSMDELSPVEINSFAEEEGKKYAKDIKTNQIRNFFAHVNQMRTVFRNAKIIEDPERHLAQKDLEKLERQLMLLKPKLAYAAGRQKVVKPMYNFISKTIDAVNDSTDKIQAFENFFDLVEGIVAYHKFNGGKDN